MPSRTELREAIRDQTAPMANRYGVRDAGAGWAQGVII